MDALIRRLRRDFPAFTFCMGDVLHWSPRTKEIFYRNTDAPYGLLHELGHALLNHQQFKNDFELLQKEVAAWQEAQRLCPQYGIAPDDAYMQRCLDSYRDWLDRRSSCPSCQAHGLQTAEQRYACPNCQQTWRVSASVLCRPYRRTKKAQTKTSPA